jgi:ribosome maturation factor RimP
MSQNGRSPVFVFSGGCDIRMRSQKPKPGVKGKSRRRGDEGRKPISPARVKEIVARAWALGEPLCESRGMELIHVEFQREPGGRVLRLYIDKPGGVRLDDCVGVSRELGDLLDVSLDESGAYNLEVSSPGPERPIGKKVDFERFMGSRAKIRITRPMDGQRNFKGVLMGLSEDGVLLQTADRTVAIPCEEISRARLVNPNGDS